MTNPTVWTFNLRGSEPADFVPFSDYEKLRADYEDFCSKVSYGFEVAKMVADKQMQLADENAKLKAAGDALAESPYFLETDPAVVAWRKLTQNK